MPRTIYSPFMKLLLFFALGGICRAFGVPTPWFALLCLLIVVGMARLGWGLR